MRCAACNKHVDIKGKILFRDECPLCGADLHVCKNCLFYDLGADNDCRESSAELVLEKDRANFCEYFQPEDENESGNNSTDEIKMKLEALFKKK